MMVAIIVNHHSTDRALTKLECPLADSPARSKKSATSRPRSGLLMVSASKAAGRSCSQARTPSVVSLCPPRVRTSTL